MQPRSILLPANLAPLCGLASTESVRYALIAVNLTKVGDTGYRLEATNGRVAGIVEGRITGTLPPALEALQSDAEHTSGLIPAKELADALRTAGKPRNTALRFLAVAIGKLFAALKSTTVEATSAAESRLIEGIFPSIDRVLPEKKPLASLDIDAKLFAKLLTVAATYSPGEHSRVTVGVHKGIVTVRTANDNQTFTGAIMPLNTETPCNA